MKKNIILVTSIIELDHFTH